MFLENDKIKLRALEPEDLDSLYQWENTTGLWMHGNTLAPYSRFALKRYITDTQQTDIYEAKQLRMMICLPNGETVGIADLYEFDIRNGRAGVGILIDEQYRKQGYATEALTLVKSYAFGFLGLHQLYAYVSIKNTASLKLFTNEGYTVSGILRNWVLVNNNFEDIQILQLIKE